MQMNSINRNVTLSPLLAQRIGKATQPNSSKATNTVTSVTISDEAAALQEKDAKEKTASYATTQTATATLSTAENPDTMDWLSITKNSDNTLTAHFDNTAQISKIIKLGYIIVDGEKITLDKDQKKQLLAAGKAMEKKQQNVMNQYTMQQQLASAQQSSDSWKKQAQMQSRIMSTATRIMQGRHVSNADEKELAEASPTLYGLAKSAATLKKIKHSNEEKNQDQRISEANSRQRSKENEPHDYSTPPLSSYPSYETQVNIDLSGNEPKIAAIAEATIAPAKN